MTDIRAIRAVEDDSYEVSLEGPEGKTAMMIRVAADGTAQATAPTTAHDTSVLRKSVLAAVQALHHARSQARAW
jgi:hypothetical protein